MIHLAYDPRMDWFTLEVDGAGLTIPGEHMPDIMAALERIRYGKELDVIEPRRNVFEQLDDLLADIEGRAGVLFGNAIRVIQADGELDRQIIRQWNRAHPVARTLTLIERLMQQVADDRKRHYDAPRSILMHPDTARAIMRDQEPVYRYPDAHEPPASLMGIPVEFSKWVPVGSIILDRDAYPTVRSSGWTHDD